MVAESVGVAVEVEHDGAVEDPVEHGGDGGAAKDLTPGRDAAVGGEDDAGLEVALGGAWNSAEVASPGAIPCSRRSAWPAT